MCVVPICEKFNNSAKLSLNDKKEKNNCWSFSESCRNQNYRNSIPLKNIGHFVYSDSLWLTLSGSMLTFESVLTIIYSWEANDKTKHEI